MLDSYDNKTLWHQFMDLMRQGLVPEALIQRWSLKTGEDVRQTIQNWDAAEAVRERRMEPLRAVAALFGTGSWIAVIVPLALANDPSGAGVILPAALTAGASFLIWLATVFARSHYNKIIDSTPRYSWDLLYRYRDLVAWAGGDPESLARLRPHQLEQLATSIVTAAALEVLKYQTESAHASLHIDSEKRGLMDDVERRHDTLRDLGLLKKIGYDPYYKAAQELLGEPLPTG